jgi:hypothetical protein
LADVKSGINFELMRQGYHNNARHKITTHVLRGDFFMLRPGRECFLHVSQQTDKRELHPANVLERTGENYTAMFEQDDVTVATEQTVVVFYEHSREFKQQQGVITQLVTTEPPLTVRFELLGKPVSAEQRQWYRVSTVMTGLSISLGDESNCPLVDVSLTGLAVFATREYHPGQIVPVEIDFDGRQYTGSVSVRSVRTLRQGRVRYGMFGLDDPKLAGNLPAGLKQISMVVQREQLQRLAGTFV